MTQELKDRWLVALRSGTYAQAQHALKTDDGEHCCLGVLCDIIDPTRWSGGGSWAQHGYDDHVSVWVDASGYIPQVFIDVETQDVLMVMNDDRCCTFPEIADWIEENAKVDGNEKK